ncbi:extracellular protein [Companilactobacillus nodensis DSM 19682 = JCM 14932 = NBRC 107160]|uniref:Extracellular protein n=1 Tax=Companilactobacillus nodensis DSM 19682 = JCM 14932 = NBRC 107160 TaxID=1423775 RepID=A0A0R1KBY9_9LACO|nr:extracellular protein [Companilactobacillus nodensis DSM 19682 = JCM 14932 = NBRC 107160]
MKKLNIILLSLVSLITLGIFTTQSVKADSLSDQPVMTLGTSLTDSQKQGTIDALSSQISGNNSNYTTVTVTGDTLVKYLNPSGSSFTSSSGVWSSALIQKTSSGSGINVKIVDYNGNNNITTITADQYRNAAVTAGISDADIYVTSATPIDGSGALAGIYAAYASTGSSLNQSQVNAAQNEMGVLSGITDANKGTDGYSDKQLNNAVAGMKSDIAQKGDNITVNQITTIVNNNLQKNNLQNIINNNQKQKIINLMVEIRDSGALKNSNFKEQASKLSSDITSKAKNLFNNLNTQENRNFIQRIWDSIVSFFQGLFN